MTNNDNTKTDLIVEKNHKEVFKQIRNYLAGRHVGATRDRTLLEEVVKCFFCKHYIETQNKDHSSINVNNLLNRYIEVFGYLKKRLPFVFDKSEEIKLDQASISFIDSELGKVDFRNLIRDPFGDLYEVFISTGVREEEGQFFTPQNGIELLISMVKPKKGDRIIDPAAGAGGFLSSALQYLSKRNTSMEDIVSGIYGIEKDSYLAKLAATRIAMMSFSECNVHCGDSLAWVDSNNKALKISSDNHYDIVLTNPPFGKYIVSATKDVQKSFDLGYEWNYNTNDNTFKRNGKLQLNVPPQVLFVEKCINLLKEGGRLGMVVPESLITSSSYSYVVDFMRNRGEFEAVLGMPEDFFKTSGKGGTHTKVCLILFTKYSGEHNNKKKLFMAEAKWCGHDSRGRNIKQDDLPAILDNYNIHKTNKQFKHSKLGYLIGFSDIENNILSPRYYNPDVKLSLDSLKGTHDILRIGDLVDRNIIEVKTGDEVGKLAYGTGTIPFVRTSDISNWEIKLDPKHGINEDIYSAYSSKQDVIEHDILMVKDGTYLIGTCAMISKYDLKIVYQSHLYKIRVLNKDIISPYILLAALSSDPVQQQIKSKRFTQDIIDSLGSRIYDLILPIPKDKVLRMKIEKSVKKAIEDKIEARELARQACLDIVATI